MNFILPKKPDKINFDETVLILSNISGDRSFLFNTCWQCLNLIKGDDEDFVTYARVVNQESEIFELNDLTPDLFKCLIFIQGLTANKDAEIKSRLLYKLEMDPKLTLQKIAKECQCIVNMKLDTLRIEERDILHVHNVWPFKKKEYRPF